MSSPRIDSRNAAIFFILIVNLVFGIACSGLDKENSNSNSAQIQDDTKPGQTNPPKDDVSELLTIIRLPEVPDEASWREEPLGKNDNRVPGPNDRKLTAVLKYNAETAAKLIAQIEKNKKPEPAEIGTENWFPEELIAQSQISGNEMLKGTVYGANDFFNMPYGNGKITRIENTNYFVLELFTT